MDNRVRGRGLGRGRAGGFQVPRQIAGGIGANDPAPIANAPAPFLRVSDLPKKHTVKVNVKKDKTK